MICITRATRGTRTPHPETKSSHAKLPATVKTSRHILALSVAFVFGVGVGSVSFGQRVTSTPGQVLANASSGAPASSPGDGDPVEQAPDGVAPKALTPARATSDEAVTEVEIGRSGDPEQRVLAMETRWSGLVDRVERLSRRVVDLERQLAERADEPGEGEAPGRSEVLPADMPEDRRIALEWVGVDRQVAQDIVMRESELAMEQLDLRDRAAREGWLGSDRFVEEMREINERAIDLRSQVGDTAYDRFLYETGQSNRVAVTSVLAGSQGEMAGLLPGDIIEDYAGEQVFGFGDLRNATASGTRDETVPVTIRRDGRLIETWMARGPIGVTLEADSAAPNW